jgi:hypothetical protein
MVPWHYRRKSSSLNQLFFGNVICCRWQHSDGYVSSVFVALPDEKNHVRRLCDAVQPGYLVEPNAG